MNLQDIFTLYEDRLKQVEQKIRELFENQIPSIPEIGSYIIASGGKRIRPLFHLISADMAGYKGTAHIAIAGIIETIHTASLLHDDVVDMADIRRGNPAANSVWGNQIVVLVGDFLYSNALRNAVMQKNQRIMETLSFATTRMTEGELLQLNRIGDPDITEEEYHDIISAKTGALIAAACRTGAILGELPDEKVDALTSFGLKTGVVFQMADDILDYRADEQELGKRLCKDLEEGKITLPILYLLKNAQKKEVSRVKNILSNGSLLEHLPEVLNLLRKYNAIEATFDTAHRLLQKAQSELSGFPDSRAKQAILALSSYSLHREK
jgi:octaprenyl-diphosphate synthase